MRYLLLLLFSLQLVACAPSLDQAVGVVNEATRVANQRIQLTSDASLRHAEATREAQANIQATADKVSADATATRMAAESEATVAALEAASTREHEMALLAIAEAQAGATVAAQATRVEATAAADYALAEQAAAALQLANANLTLAGERERAAAANTLRDIRNAGVAALFAATVIALLAYVLVWTWRQRNGIVAVQANGTTTILVRPNQYTALPRAASAAALPAATTIEQEPEEWNAIDNPPLGFGLTQLAAWGKGDGVALGIVNGQPLRITHTALDGAFPHVLVCARSGAGKSFTMLRPIVASMLRDGNFTVYIADQTFKDYQQFDGHPNVRAVHLETPQDLIDLMRMTYALVLDRGREIVAAGDPELTTWSRYRQATPDAPGRVAVVVDEYNNLLRELPRSDAQELARLTDMVASRGRASGIHLLAGVQDPTREDFPKSARRNMVPIALQLQDATTSRLVLGSNGAERLRRGQFLVSRGGELVAGNAFVLNAEHMTRVLEGEYTALPDPGLQGVKLWQGRPGRVGGQSAESRTVYSGQSAEAGDAAAIAPYLGMGQSRTALLNAMEDRGVTGWAKNGENIGRMTAALRWLADNGTARQRQAVQALRGYPWND
ncbi:MAG: hypothetical protein M9918_19435 [Anaerolineae bacterium]|nr:hypothetical protein [Anaerolineae bacterium]